jgi:hypothetical protein
VLCLTLAYVLFKSGAKFRRSNKHVTVATVVGTFDAVHGTVRALWRIITLIPIAPRKAGAFKIFEIISVAKLSKQPHTESCVVYWRQALRSVDREIADRAKSTG